MPSGTARQTSAVCAPLRIRILRTLYGRASGTTRTASCRTGDAAGMEFIILDKKNAQLYAFDDKARLKGSSVILIGAAVGDDTVPGIGLREIASDWRRP